MLTWALFKRAFIPGVLLTSLWGALLVGPSFTEPAYTQAQLNEQLTSLKTRYHQLAIENERLKAENALKTEVLPAQVLPVSALQSQLQTQLQALKTENDRLKQAALEPQNIPNTPSTDYSALEARLSKARQALVQSIETINGQNARINQLNQQLAQLQRQQDQVFSSGTLVGLNGVTKLPVDTSKEAAEIEKLKAQLKKLEAQRVSTQTLRQTIEEQTSVITHLRAKLSQAEQKLASLPALPLLASGQPGPWPDELPPALAKKFKQSSPNKALANPISLESLSEVALAYKEQKQYPQAEAFWQAALVLYPKEARLYFNLGNAYLAQNHLSEAETAYQQALTLTPTYGKALYNLALLKAQANDEVAARDLFSRYLPFEPNPTNAALIREYLQAMEEKSTPKSPVGEGG